MNLIKEATLSIRKKRPFFPSDHCCDVFRSGDLLEIGVLRHRCSRDQQGSCMMCDYGMYPDTHSIEAYIREIDQILMNLDDTINILLLCTNGSFLDERQICPNLFQTILERAAQCKVPFIEVETHYQDVTGEKLELLRHLLPNKGITIELGLETALVKYQEKIIMKGIDLKKFERVVAFIQNFGFDVDINLMVGLPFLSPKEQLEDALNSIRWCFDHRARPVLFPVNIKPYTLLMEAYRFGFYRPVSQWMLPLILDELPIGWLEQIVVAWYGNREEIYDAEGERAVFPRGCPKCSVAIRNYLDNFAAALDGRERKKMLSRLLTETDCQCLEQAKQELLKESGETFEERYASFLSWLEKQKF